MLQWVLRVNCTALDHIDQVLSRFCHSILHLLRSYLEQRGSTARGFLHEESHNILLNYFFLLAFVELLLLLNLKFSNWGVYFVEEVDGDLVAELIVDLLPIAE